jgi:hypothetical protein
MRQSTYLATHLTAYIWATNEKLMRSLHIKFTHYLESSEWPICGALLFYYSSWWLSFPRACEGEWNDSPVNKRGWVAGALCKYAISRDGSHRRLHTYPTHGRTWGGRIESVGVVVTKIFSRLPIYKRGTPFACIGGKCWGLVWPWSNNVCLGPPCTFFGDFAKVHTCGLYNPSWWLDRLNSGTLSSQ